MLDNRLWFAGERWQGVWPTLIGAALGVIVAVIAVLVTNYFDNQRFAAEREAQTQQRQQERQEDQERTRRKALNTCYVAVVRARQGVETADQLKTAEERSKRRTEVHDQLEHWVAEARVDLEDRLQWAEWAEWAVIEVTAWREWANSVDPLSRSQHSHKPTDDIASFKAVRERVLRNLLSYQTHLDFVRRNIVDGDPGNAWDPDDLNSLRWVARAGVNEWRAKLGWDPLPENPDDPLPQA